MEQHFFEYGIASDMYATEISVLRDTTENNETQKLFGCVKSYGAKVIYIHDIIWYNFVVLILS